MARKATKRYEPRSRGRIEERGAGKFLCRVFLGTDSKTGKRNYSSRTVKGTRKEAEKELTKMLREIDTQTFVEPSRRDLEGFLGEWLEMKTDVAPSTLASYRQMVKDYIVPHLPPRKLETLSTQDVQAMVTGLNKAKRSPRTIQYAFTVLKQALNQAVLWNLLGRNPCVGVVLPKRDRKEMEVLSPDEVQLFLERTQGSEFYPLWILLLTSGLRPQEALALKWTDIDGRKVSVRRALSRAQLEGSFLEARETKTKKSRRTLSVPKETQGALEAHRENQRRSMFSGELRNPRGWVFPSPKTGELLSPSWVRTNWYRDLEAARMPKVRLYDARHTHMTHLLMAGVHPKVASDRAGHSTIQQTMDTYSHVIGEVDAEAADVAADLIFKTRKEA